MLTQSRLLVGVVVPAAVLGGVRLFDGIVTGNLAAAVLGLGVAVTAWLLESAASYHLAPYRLCDPGFRPQVPAARLLPYRHD